MVEINENADFAQVLQVLRDTPEQPDTGPDRFRTSNGIVFKLKPVPPLLLRDIGKNVKRPVPPKVYIEDKETHEENLNDPDYVRALMIYQETVSEAANAVLLVRGTEAEHIPEGVDKPESDAWIEDLLDTAGVEVPANSRARRYYCWMKYVALVRTGDFFGIMRKITAQSGNTLEEGVTQALESFPGNQAGNANNGVHAGAADGRRDTDSPGDAGTGA